MTDTDTLHTKDKLAAALREVDLDEMAERAATGYYHDYLSPLDSPEFTLINELSIEATKRHPEERRSILNLRAYVINGDFDASAEESKEWANSPEGQEAFRSLLETK
jgi:hypothetical protein